MTTTPSDRTPSDREPVAPAYDSWAEPYVRLFADPASGHPWDRVAMTVLAETILAGEPGPVLDLGCGPGHWTAYLAALGLDVSGVDLSSEFVTHARAAHPALRFEVGSMAATGRPDRSLRGAVAWFSLIHIDPAELPGVLLELRRLLALDAPLLIGFQTTDGPDGSPVPYDHRVAPSHLWPLDTLAGLLTATGFVESTRLVRRPEGTERSSQGALLVRAG